ncbi:hypothetical protein B0O99DRAFT_576411 [Bisporella sp. PMI_857]|nr:hypothetical protein B0O99DRAFT_576411 [Bisporella sp. PMI_857]
MAALNIYPIFALLVIVAQAAPTITFPLNSQVPPVARVGQPFQYTFSSSTFTSTLPLKYYLTAAPNWLSLNSNTRTLSGTPSADDFEAGKVAGVSIGITAEDESGSTTLNATIVVSEDPAPIVNVPLASQLPSFGLFSLPSKVLYHPSSPFKFSMDPETFRVGDGSSKLTYYAVTADNTPLPSWITFDQASFTFSGQTPDYASLIQPPQQFGVKVIASDVAGFSGATVSFDIEVGVHLFAFKNSSMTANFTAGIEGTFDSLANNLEIDSQPATSSVVASIDMQGPSWLSFDNSTYLLSGTPSEDAIPTNITVQATDVYGDTTKAVIFVDIALTIFTSEVGTLNASTGSFFSYDLSTYLRNKSDIDMKLVFDSSISWLHFDSQTFNLSGDVPSTAQVGQVNLNMQAISKSTQNSNSQSFNLAISADSSTTAQSSPSGTTGASSTTTDNTDVTHENLSTGEIIGIVVGCSVLLALALFLIFFCCRRRKRVGEPDQEKNPEMNISAPLESDEMTAEVQKPAPTALPPPLRLDTSGFGVDNRSSVYSGDLSRRSTRSNVDNRLRRSLTFSGVSSMSGPSMSRTTTSGNLASRTRANSDNALPRSESSANWRYTQDNSYLAMPSRANSIQASTQRTSRTYSNYSRKGHKRRSGRVWTIDQPQQRDSFASSGQATSPILNLKDSNFSTMPLANFSALPKKGDTTEKQETDSSPIQSPTPPKAVRRNSKLMSPLDRTRSGIGHGSRESIDSIISGTFKRRSIGHGQDWATSHGLRRDSRTWLTMDPNERGLPSTGSNSTNVTEATEILHPRNSAHLSHTSPQNTEQRPHSRPISRRIIGSTPFFSGRTESVVSRKSPKTIRNSAIDSPTIAEDRSSASLSDQHVDPTNEEPVTSRHAPGLSYSSTRESTKQLKSYLQHHVSRNNTKTSMRSTASRDSRFESASPSMQSMQRLQRDGDGDTEMQDAEDEYEDFLPDNCSDGSWETHHDSRRNSRANAADYIPGARPKMQNYGSESSQLTIVSNGERPAESDGPGTSKAGVAAGASNPSILGPTSSPLMGTAGNARIVRGHGKSPTSVDTGMKGVGSVQAMIEGPDLESEEDYSAYV